MEKTTKSKRTGWLPGATTLGIAFVLTLLVAISAYIVNAPLDASQLLFVLLVLYAVVLAARWLWARINTSRRENP